ncbi:MAG: hypothetical protein HXX11_23585 [Desulfuromonadales bacterium]|nr:hypothetical protein [Desulfuromonadales bacterium]
MNKIKLLYDVARTMKAKEKVDGVLTAQVHKDQVEVFSLRNDFGKNSTGDASAKVSCELNLEGNRIKRESLTEFSTAGDCQQRGRLLGKLFRHHHGTGECCGIKGIFSRIAIALGILSSLKSEEQENGGAVVSLNVSDLPEEMKTQLLERMNQKHAYHSHCGFLAEGDALETVDGVVVLTVNKAREIEKLTVNLDGRMQNAASESHLLSAHAEVQFAW